jgi:hypothetical protein
MQNAPPRPASAGQPGGTLRAGSLPGTQGGDAPGVCPVGHSASCWCRQFAAGNDAASVAAVGILPAAEELAAGARNSSGSSRGRCSSRFLWGGARGKARGQQRPARWQAMGPADGSRHQRQHLTLRPSPQPQPIPHTAPDFAAALGTICKQIHSPTCRSLHPSRERRRPPPAGHPRCRTLPAVPS